MEEEGQKTLQPWNDREVRISFITLLDCLLTTDHLLGHRYFGFDQLHYYAECIFKILSGFCFS